MFVSIKHHGMQWSIRNVSLQDILPLRALFLQENNFQIRYDARHRRGWTDSYLISQNDHPVGYGSIAGKKEHADRDSLFEFYLLPPYRHQASPIFSDLIQLTQVTEITCQTNDTFLCSLTYQFTGNIQAEAYLFSDHHVTNYQLADTAFRKRTDDEVIPGYQPDQMGSYILLQEQEIVATGDFYLHYNPPFADLWMEVKESHRRKGIGTYLLQELKKECYLAGRVPAARCNIDNMASKACLLKAGLQLAGCMISGEVKK